MLADGVLPGATVIILNPTSDGIGQITSALTQHQSPQSLHIISHGAPGTLHLGATQINSHNLEDYRHQLQQWARAFSDKPDILLYGCNVASGETGTKFIQRLGEITSGNIAASTMPVGNAALGGKWHLANGVGQVSCGLALLPETMAAYPGLLVSFTAATNFNVGSTPYSVAVGDFNGDSKPEKT